MSPSVLYCQFYFLFYLIWLTLNVRFFCCLHSFVSLLHLHLLLFCPSHPSFLLSPPFFPFPLFYIFPSSLSIFPNLLLFFLRLFLCLLHCLIPLRCWLFQLSFVYFLSLFNHYPSLLLVFAFINISSVDVIVFTIPDYPFLEDVFSPLLLFISLHPVRKRPLCPPTGRESPGGREEDTNPSSPSPLPVTEASLGNSLLGATWIHPNPAFLKPPIRLNQSFKICESVLIKRF